MASLGNHLVTVSADDTFRIWTTTGSFACVSETPSDSGRLYGLAVSDHVCYIAIITSSYQHIGQQVLFTCGEDSYIRMWDVSDPARPQLARLIHDSYRRVNGPVNALLIHRNRLVAGSTMVKMFT